MPFRAGRQQLMNPSPLRPAAASKNKIAEARRPRSHPVPHPRVANDVPRIGGIVPQHVLAHRVEPSLPLMRRQIWL